MRTIQRVAQVILVVCLIVAFIGYLVRLGILK